MDSLDWVRTHDSQKFLESFYFQYGHASIADLGHVVLCFEGVSELAAIEIEDEPLWDGQARSSRYQDFGRSGFIVPESLNETDRPRYEQAGARMLETYQHIHAGMVEHLSERLPRPEAMKPEVYRRNIAARAFDVARYLLFLAIPTGVGQVTSIRTLERQIRRMKASPYREVCELAGEIAEACSRPPSCGLPESPSEAVAPTLARHVGSDSYLTGSAADLRQWAEQNLPKRAFEDVVPVDLLKPTHTSADIVATLLYPVADRPFRELYEMAAAWNVARRAEVIDVALQSRTARDELLRNYRSGPYAFDFIMDIGAYRDLHRHRRCHQFRQPYTIAFGYEVPEAIGEAGLTAQFRGPLDEVFSLFQQLPAPDREFLLPFATRSRFLFKMDFAEAEYISRLRSGVKGHFSYRRLAWHMKEAMMKVDPELGRLINATPPWVDDPLQR